MIPRSLPNQPHSGTPAVSSAGLPTPTDTGPAAVTVAQAPLRTRGMRRAYRRLGTKETGFRYVDDDGRVVEDARLLERFGRLRIPPAWQEVRIARQAGARIQAIGVDGKGRKQYIYSERHVRWRTERKQSKLAAFAAALPAMRARTARDLQQESLGRERVLAAMVRLIDEVAFRAGNERYARESRTFGITTLEKRHVRITDEGVQFSYAGKHGIRQHHVIVDEAIGDVLTGLLRLRGKRLFKFVDEHGRAHPVASRLLNQYIQAVMGPDVSAKDFRTWIGTVQCAERLAEHGAEDKAWRQRRAIVEACRAVADRLGNTVSVARSSYVDPRVIERYLEGKTIERLLAPTRRTVHARDLPYEPAELAVMRLLGVRLMGVERAPKPVEAGTKSRTA